MTHLQQVHTSYSFPNSSTNWRSHIQIYILVGAILIQTNPEGKQELAQERISNAGESCCEKQNEAERTKGRGR